MIISDSEKGLMEEVFRRLRDRGFYFRTGRPTFKTEGTLITAEITYTWMRNGKPVKEAELDTHIKEIADELDKEGYIVRAEL